MPIRSEWTLAREGVTGDTIARLLKLTVLNPVITLPLLLAAKYTTSGNILSEQHGTAFKCLKKLLGLGLLSSINSWLNDAVTNNWTNDVYVWSREVVVVTGGSDGIGKIVVRLLAEKGIKVAVLDVQELTYEAPPSVHFFKCDLSSPSSIASAASSIRSSLGNPTVLINNAGVARGKTILDTTEKDINLTFKVNTFAHYYLAQEFLPSMVEKNHGMVVTVASLAGYITASSLVDYAASKSAAVSFHEGLAAELITHYKAPKVRTVLMCQGYTRTALFEGFGGRALFPETVAEEIVKAVLSGKSKHLTLPEAAWAFAPRVRGFPLWMQYGMRKRMDHLMRVWKGRQVVQPSEVEGEGDSLAEDKKVSDSTVLVDGDSH
ncbi:NAD(P)-binding protein [Cucurbitaria berberidis CBS 394.84]|uniref:Short-chain dehydrogenase/reductase 3 n=1 Tax=Cucurbitaria berberidis CBS 394.84 TaxID=1168544 RepID=A0A9P4GNL7_9PLEO|nr:NAD(P)-binding protein [Cucurbitaria berberidis CBS 394.84]KAF1848472.1 NAD(P)-binding protein [Cucurbitaria berberidis CBS 394.84]